MENSVKIVLEVNPLGQTIRADQDALPALGFTQSLDPGLSVLGGENSRHRIDCDHFAEALAQFFG